MQDNLYERTNIYISMYLHHKLTTTTQLLYLVRNIVLGGVGGGCAVIPPHPKVTKELQINTTNCN